MRLWFYGLVGLFIVTVGACSENTPETAPPTEVSTASDSTEAADTSDDVDGSDDIDGSDGSTSDQPEPDALDASTGEVGACCLGTTCKDIREGACNDAGGVFQGPASTCAG